MHLGDEIYISDTVTDVDTAVYALRREVPVFRLWCVCLHEDRLEVQSARSLCTPYGKSRDWLILGIAMGRKNAVELLLQIAKDAAAQGLSMTDQRQWARLVMTEADAAQERQR